MYLQLPLILALACVLSQAEPHFGHLGGGVSVDAGGSGGGSFVGDLLRASANVKNQLAEVADNTAGRVRGMFHKKGQSNGSVGFQSGYVIQATPYGNQPPINAYGSGPSGGGNFGYNIGIAPASSYDSSRPVPSSGNLGGHVNVGVSGSSAAGSLLGDDHLEYVSATGERRRLTYEEVVQLILIVIESSKTSSGAGGPAGGAVGGYAGGYTGAPAGGYTGAPAGGYTGAPAGGYTGAPAGGYTGATAGGYTGAPAGGYTGAPAGGYTGVPAGGYTGVSAGGYVGVPTGGYPGVPTGGPTGKV